MAREASDKEKVQSPAMSQDQLLNMHKYSFTILQPYLHDMLPTECDLQKKTKRTCTYLCLDYFFVATMLFGKASLYLPVPYLLVSYPVAVKNNQKCKNDKLRFLANPLKHSQKA